MAAHALGLAGVVGREVVRLVPIERGHLANLRYRAELDDGTMVFVKVPTNPFTTAVLASERRAHESLGRRPFMPRYIGGTDELLVTEYIGDAHWPTPWRDGDLAVTLRLLERIGSVEGPAVLRDLEDDTRHRVWWKVADHPGPFLSLGVCDRGWFDSNADVLVATDDCPLGGSTLVHGDFRSDNLCIRDSNAIAVDWASAARGRPDYDATAFAMSFALETGLTPDVVAPAADPALVSVFAGTYAYAAGLMSIPAPIREQLHAQLLVALSWCARVLDLPQPLS
jgi:hypothetical protein